MHRLSTIQNHTTTQKAEEAGGININILPYSDYFNLIIFIKN